MNSYSNSSRAARGMLLAFIGGMVTWALLGGKIKRKLNENEAYREIKSKVSEQTNKIANLTQEKYNQVVDEASNTYAKAKGISQNELKDLVRDLKFHWSRIKDKWKNPESSGRKISERSNDDLPYEDRYNY